MLPVAETPGTPHPLPMLLATPAATLAARRGRLCPAAPPPNPPPPMPLAWMPPPTLGVVPGVAGKEG